MLTSYGQCDLCEQPADLYIGDSSSQLVTAAYTAKQATCLLGFSFDGRPRQQAVDFSLGDSVVSTGGLDTLQLSAVDPLFQRRVADTQHLSCLARTVELGHGLEQTIVDEEGLSKL